MATVKITVVHRGLNPGLVDRYLKKDRHPNGFGVCPFLSDGQQFVVRDEPDKPSDFPCEWAWNDIHRDVAIVLFGGSLPWMAEPGTAITCCSDAFRPVSFLVERISEP